MCYTVFVTIESRGAYILYRFVTRIAAAAAAVLMLGGCTQIVEESPEPVSETVFTESPYPVAVGSLIFNESPESVGSLSPALTEIICELGYSDKITGRSIYCKYPESITGKKELGSAANPDADAIIEAAPQLLMSQSPIAKKDITAIENAGTRVWIISAPKSVAELYACYTDISAVFGGKLNSAAAAEDALDPLKEALYKAENSVESFVYIMSPSLAAASNSTFAGEFFSHFGKNAAGDKEDNALTAEELLELDPQWIIIPCTMDTDDLPEEVSGLEALKNGKVIVLDEETMERIERPTSRLDSAVYEVLEQINGGGMSTDSENTEE